MRIAFILPTFAAGGAERVASLLCNFWAEQGHDVIALTFEGAGDEQIYFSMREWYGAASTRSTKPDARIESPNQYPPFRASPRRAEIIPAERYRGLHH